MTNAESWLCAILECGVDDLAILDTKYNYGELVDECKGAYDTISLSHLVSTIVERGCRDLQYAIEWRLWEQIDNDEYEMLDGLDPWMDIELQFNYLDTEVRFTRHEDIYKKYMFEACEKFMEDTGFSLW